MHCCHNALCALRAKICILVPQYKRCNMPLNIVKCIKVIKVEYIEINQSCMQYKKLTQFCTPKSCLIQFMGVVKSIAKQFIFILVIFSPISKQIQKMTCISVPKLLNATQRQDHQDLNELL